MDIEHRISTFLKYVMAGGEVEIQGRTYVWLNNHVIRSTEDAQYVIDGLAIKGTSYNGALDSEGGVTYGKGEVTYLGQSDMPLRSFINLVYSIKDTVFEEMLVNNALSKYRRERHG